MQLMRTRFLGADLKKNVNCVSVSAAAEHMERFKSTSVMSVYLSKVGVIVKVDVFYGYI